VEIVKNLQRLQGIDGDYDNDSGSGPDRIARRKTIQNLEKARQPRRQIGTLDVAFKKRFLKLTADENNAATPILTRRMTMRKETIRALEHRKNSVMAERKKSQMQTLGAHNEYGVTGMNTGMNIGMGVGMNNVSLSSKYHERRSIISISSDQPQ
jgi:chitin synthase